VNRRRYSESSGNCHERVLYDLPLLGNYSLFTIYDLLRAFPETSFVQLFDLVEVQARTNDPRIPY
jgi:hypothetical protein